MIYHSFFFLMIYHSLWFLEIGHDPDTRQFLGIHWRYTMPQNRGLVNVSSYLPGFNTDSRSKLLSAWEAVAVVLGSPDSCCVSLLFRGPRDGQVTASISGSTVLTHRARKRMWGHGCGWSLWRSTRTLGPQRASLGSGPEREAGGQPLLQIQSSTSYRDVTRESTLKSSL